MGEAKRRRLTQTQRLISSHPWCCFCGGSTPATSADHQPPRAFFRGREAPEGYTFPACDACNGGSTNADRLFAFMARLSHTGYRNDADRAEFRKLIAGINRYRPGLLRRSLPSAGFKKRVIRTMGLPLVAGIAAGEAPLVVLDELWTEAARAVLGKLGRALHYHHTGTIIPQGGAVEVVVFDNTAILSGRYDKSLSDLLPAHQTTKRGRVDLGDQFSYRFGVTEDGQHSLFLCQFNGQMLAMIQPSCVPLPDDGEESGHSVGASAGGSGGGPPSNVLS